jgi:hypothetical protein
LLLIRPAFDTAAAPCVSTAWLNDEVIVPALLLVMNPPAVRSMPTGWH